MQDSRFDINKIKKTYKDMRNYFNDIRELSKSEEESTHAQFVIDMLLKWESTQFKAKQKIPISFNEYLVFTILLPNETNNNDPSIVDGLWAYQYFLINIGEKKEADTLEYIMRNKVGREEWNETKKRNVMAANLLRSAYEKIKRSDHEASIEEEDKIPNQLDFDFMKDDKDEKRKLDQQEEQNSQESEKEDKFDMIKYLEKERRQKILKPYLWIMIFIILTSFISYILYGVRLGRLNEKLLIILIGAVIVMVLGFIVITFVIKKFSKDGGRGQKDP
ncbi:MAG TPA: hypothetical protein VGA95_00830 [Thermodesulfobacteriota bacterium]